MLEKVRSLFELGWVFTVEYDNTIALFGVWARRDDVAYGRYDIRLERAIMDVLEVIG